METKKGGLIQECRDFLAGFLNSGLSDFLPGLMLAPSESGVAVTEMTAMQIAAVAGCIRVLSNSVGMLPCNIYERVDGGSNLATKHSLYPLLHDAPNEEYAAVDFWSLLETHRVLTGNGYAEIVRNIGGQPVEFWVRNPFRTFPYRDMKSGGLVYKTTDTSDGHERIIAPENILHIKNISIDPWVGLSPIRYYAREVLGAAIATQNYGARLFSNDARPGGYLASADVMQPDRKLQLAQAWQASHSRSGSHTMAILDGGLKWESVGIAPEEAQFIATRQMQREDIAAIYGVPTHFLGSSTGERSANLEQRFLEFLVMSLKPNLRRYECELNAKLFAGIGRNANKFFVKFDTAEFERADFASTLKALQVGRYAGLYSVDEGRRMLGLNPVDPDKLSADNPGDSLWMPINMVNIEVGEEDEPSKGLPDVQVPVDTKPEKTPDKVEPGTAPDAVSDSRALFNIFYKSFEDALGRITARSKVNLADFERVFTPLLAGVAASALPIEGDIVLPLDVASAIKTHCSGIFERSQTWDKSKLGEMAADELNEAIIKILPVAKAAGQGLEEVNNEVNNE